VIVDILRVIIVAALVILGGLIVAGKIRFTEYPGERGENRWQRHTEESSRLFALMLILIVLGEAVWSPIKCLAIPVFAFGGYYILYDAFLRKR